MGSLVHLQLEEMAYAFGSADQLEEVEATDTSEASFSEESKIEQEVIEDKMHEETTEEIEQETIFEKIATWFKDFFSRDDSIEGESSEAESLETKDKEADGVTIDSSEICILDEEYFEQTNENTLVLSLPFNVNDYYPSNWGIIPFCADP